MQDATLLPEDLGACHALIAEFSARMTARDALLVEQSAAVVDLQAAREKLAQENEELTLTIQKLLARLAGHRPERFDDPRQLKLDFGADPGVQDGLADAATEAETILQEFTVRRRVGKQKKPRNEQLPAHLRREEVVAEMPEADQQCPAHGPRQVVGYEVTETLVFKRPELWVLRTKYPKFVCPDNPDCGVVEPARPEGLVEGNRYDTSVAAEIIVGKYAYHLPIYREQDWFASSGWMPQRSTLLNIMASAADVLKPLYEHYVELVRSGPVIPADETEVMLLLPREVPAAIEGDARSRRVHEVLSRARATDKTHVKARMWVYRNLEADGANVFDFTVSRHRDGPADFLKGYTGTLLGDCYSGFEAIQLASDNRIVRAACHAHVRRKIFEARLYHPVEAPQLLAWYRQLYDAEDQGRGKSPEEVLALRQQHSVPLMDNLRDWLNSPAAKRVLPKSKLGEAMIYIRNQWDALCVFLNDGRVPFDNNETEQLMKHVATGRKNWLFIGSVDAGHRAAILLTIVSTAHRYNLDVWLYVKDILDRLQAGDRDFEAMRAQHWALAHPEAIRTYRQEEARYRADTKQVRRERRRMASQKRS